MPFDETEINENVTEIEKTTDSTYSSQTGDTFVKVANIIVETAGCNFEDITLASKLQSLGVDSLKAITVLFELEEVFDIEIPNEMISTIVTVQDIMDKVEKLNTKAA
ncbi:MAG: phosphopantetheine-binding protein [Methylococcaceae bacterium]